MSLERKLLRRQRQDPNDARRWVQRLKRNRNRSQIAERNISPEEARVALMTILLEGGIRLERILDYDPRKDYFTVQGYHKDEDCLRDFAVRGEHVGELVTWARIAARMPNGLIRPSEWREQQQAKR